MNNGFRAEQLDSGIDAGAVQGQKLDSQQLFAGGNAEFFAAKQSGKEQNMDLQPMQLVEAQVDPPKRTEVAQKPGAQEIAQQPFIETLKPAISWKIDVQDTAGGGKHMGIKGLGEGDLVKQADGSFSGELKNANGDKTLVQINPDGTVKVELDGEDYKFKLKPDGTVDTVTNLSDSFYERTDRSDGSGEMRFKDGTPGFTFQRNADGSEDRKYTDGSTEHVSEGGSLRKYPNGSTREQLADGTTVYTDAATGVVVRATPDAVTTINYKDGTKITRLPNGTTVTKDPDGTSRTQTTMGTDSKLPDGTVIHTTRNLWGDFEVKVVPPGTKPVVQHRQPVAPKAPPRTASSDGQMYADKPNGH